MPCTFYNFEKVALVFLRGGFRAWYIENREVRSDGKGKKSLEAFHKKNARKRASQPTSLQEEKGKREDGNTGTRKSLRKIKGRELSSRKKERTYVLRKVD